MSGIQFLRKSRALALGIALAAAAGGYAIARATPSVAAGGHIRASIRIADPSEGPSKLGFAPIVKQVLPNVVNISSSQGLFGRPINSKECRRIHSFSSFLASISDLDRRSPSNAASRVSAQV